MTLEVNMLELGLAGFQQLRCVTNRDAIAIYWEREFRFSSGDPSDWQVVSYDKSRVFEYDVIENPLAEMALVDAMTRTRDALAKSGAKPIGTFVFYLVVAKDSDAIFWVVVADEYPEGKSAA